MYMCDVKKLTSCEKLDVELSLKTRYITTDCWKIVIIIYDEVEPTIFPIFKATQLLGKKGNSFAVAICSYATLEDCEHLAGELMQAMGIQLEAGCDLHKKFCNELARQILAEVIR